MNVSLGCGDTKTPDCVNVDFRKTEAVDVLHDLRDYPWPFQDNEFDNAIAKDIVEHIPDVIPFIDECWRIVKPGGRLYIRTTYFRSEQAYQDPTHWHYFALDSFDYFDPDTTAGKKYGWYSARKWQVYRKAIDGHELTFALIKQGG